MTVLGCDELVALDATDVVDLGIADAQFVTALDGVPLDLVVVSGNPVILGSDPTEALEVQAGTPDVLSAPPADDSLIVTAGAPGADGADGFIELYDSLTPPVSAPATYLRFERDLDGDVQRVWIGTVD